MRLLGPLLVGMACVLPLRVLDVLARTAAWVWWTVIPVRRAVALDNLARASGVPEGPARGPLLRRHVGELVLGYFELVRWQRLGARSGVRVEVHGLEHLRPGTVALVGHLGSWDLGILAVARASAVPIALHLRSPRDPWSRRFIGELRAWAGLHALDPASRMAGADAFLRAGGVVAFVQDQAYLRGPAVPFLGRPAHTSTGFARASLAWGRTIGAWATRRGVGHHAVFLAPLDVPNVGLLERTTWANAWLAERVRAEPHAWLWLHRRWKER